MLSSKTKLRHSKKCAKTKFVSFNYNENEAKNEKWITIDTTVIDLGQDVETNTRFFNKQRIFSTQPQCFFTFQ